MSQKWVHFSMSHTRRLYILHLLIKIGWHKSNLEITMNKQSPLPCDIWIPKHENRVLSKQRGLKAVRVLLQQWSEEWGFKTVRRLINGFCKFSVSHCNCALIYHMKTWKLDFQHVEIPSLWVFHKSTWDIYQMTNSQLWNILNGCINVPSKHNIPTEIWSINMQVLISSVMTSGQIWNNICTVNFQA